MEIINNQDTQQATADATTTINVNPTTGKPESMQVEGFTRMFNSRKEAILVLDTMDEMGWSDRYQFDAASKTMTLVNMSDKDMNLLQRKTNIRQWSSRTIAVANAVTNFAEDVADYALNGALAPTVGAVSNAALTTGRVVGTAAVKASAMVLASTIRNGRQAATEIRHSKEVADAWNEVKGLGSDIASAIFGSDTESASSGWSRISA